ncbi:MAG: aspartyl protease family protein [Chloroflexota bacterium]|nr:aspartyl protease family protein [Chloroflexota bacterium]MDE2969182.1 aspartyl protease family protein [Chloroflexota bacterium]
MLYGTFDTDDASLNLEGTLILPQLQFQRQTNFLVDTGATSSSVHPHVFEDLGIDLQAIMALPTSPIWGIGGSITVYNAHGFLAFQDSDNAYLYEVAISIYDPKNPPDVPSVIGRDILERWRMVYAKAHGVLEFDVLDADYTWGVSV